MTPPVVIIIMGVAGSGKTTIGRRLAAALHWQFHDADDDHAPEHIEQMRSGSPLTDAQRQPWLVTLRDRIEQWLHRSERTVLAVSALTREARRLLRVDDQRVRFVYLKASPDLIHKRLTAREHFMSPTLLASQFQALQEPRGALVVDAVEHPEDIVQTIREKLGV